MLLFFFQEKKRIKIEYFILKINKHKKTNNNK